ncbi:MAG TPA: ABC transporter ATP-binding protein [Thermoanaerobaculia bacterium]|nr:ABC transporter ATP-binding protein [Thermoanaerobaculia bacterium]
MASSSSPALGGGHLAATGLGYAYRGTPALAGVELEVKPGEVVGLLGPNGSGKSTLIKILSGVLADYQGTVRLGGQDLRGLPRRQIARSLAVVPQEPTFSFPFTVLEIVLMGRHPHLGAFAFESAADLAVARDALERCAASHLAARTIQELSAGERQRVVFARALAQAPRVLLLDEPASHLDIRHQVELYDLVRELAEREATSVLSVLHELNLAAEYCDRVYLLRDGRVAHHGPTAEVFTYEILTGVFATDLYVATNDLTGHLIVSPLPGRARDPLRR